MSKGLHYRIAETIWNTSRADEGTVSATGANIIADALLPLIAAECSEAARQAAEGAREATEHDRRELWRLNNFLIVNGTTATHRARQRALSDYLHRTCTHDWADVSGWGGCPKGTHQCDWCNAVLTPDEWDALARAASLARQTADGGGEE